MGAFSYIELADLLRQREAEFVRVWTCEQEVKQLLPGVEFPFTPPPPLPSRALVRKKTAVTRNNQAPPSRIRELSGTENAYRVTYLSNGRREVAYQTDGNLLNTLVDIQGEDFTMLRVDAGVFEGVEHWKSSAVVWTDEERGRH